MSMVIVIDDDADIRLSLQEILEDAGYSVALCPNATSAHETLLITPPSVVLLDQRMPGMSGIEFLRAFDVAHSPHRFALLTALQLALPPEDEALRRHLAVPMVHKPFDIDDMLAVVGSLTAQVGLV